MHHLGRRRILLSAVDVGRGRLRIARLLLCVSRLRVWLGGNGGGIRLTHALLWFGAYRRLDALDLVHVYNANPRAPGWRILAHLLDTSRRKRAAGILLQFGLLPLEGHRRRRRSGAGYDWPAQHTGGRTWSAGRLSRPRAENAGLLGCNLRSPGDGG